MLKSVVLAFGLISLGSFAEPLPPHLAGGRQAASERLAHTSYNSEESIRAVDGLLKGLADEGPQSRLVQHAETARWQRDLGTINKILTQTASLYCKSPEGSAMKQKAKEVLSTVSTNMGRAIALMISENGYFSRRDERDSFMPPPALPSDERIQLGIRVFTKTNEVEIHALDSALWDAADVIKKECGNSNEEVKPVSSERKESAQSDNPQLDQLLTLLEDLQKFQSGAGSTSHGREQRRPATVAIDDDLRTALFSYGRPVPPMMMGFDSKVTPEQARAQLPNVLHRLLF